MLTGAPDNPRTTHDVFFPGQPSQAAVARHRVSDDRQRSESGRRSRERTALDRPELVVR